MGGNTGTRGASYQRVGASVSGSITESRSPQVAKLLRQALAETEYSLHLKGKVSKGLPLPTDPSCATNFSFDPSPAYCEKCAC
ncbi:hypothetical protein E2C01_055305 [Portunus trituberculatus]|uniref:Uncharacterized protein n=1 Tax=Portunus trituberculatus TaxID=210409 RepID=A0A5B7GWG5_PORTR|nr:hypothetical protein [Portunus trituberculatus]